MLVIPFILGLSLLLFGKRLFWVCVGGIGFMAGMALASHLLHEQSESLKIVLGLGIGLVGAALAFFLQRLAVGLAGFVAGAYFAYALLARLPGAAGDVWWLPVLLGGILGSIVLLMAFDWTLIVLSSLTGAAFLLQSIHVRDSLVLPLYILLTVSGFLVQSGLLRKRRHPQPGHAGASK